MKCISSLLLDRSETFLPVRKLVQFGVLWNLVAKMFKIEYAKADEKCVKSGKTGQSFVFGKLMHKIFTKMH